MATILLAKQGTPPLPSTGDVRFWISTTNEFCSINDAGLITVYGESLTQEQVQDFVGAMFADTSTINATYNDTGNAVTFDVIAGGVDHNSLLNFVANKHIDHSAVSITAGTGLTGGGDLTATRTISMPNVGTANTYGSASSVPVFTTDAQGRVSSVTNTAVAVTSGNVTDFVEAAQDAVGGILTDTASVDLTYNDALNTITAAVLPAGVDHNALNNYSANRHIDHSTVSITAGTGLSGGGDLTATRTLSIPNSGVTATSYGSATQVASFTVNALGLITSASSVSVAIPSTAVTDFSEAVDDRVAALVQNGTGLTWTYNDPSNTLTANVSLAAFTTTNLAEGANLYYTDARARASQSATDSASIDFTYTPATGVLTGVVLPAGVDHNALSNYSANRHIDHSAVSITAGTGLTGGGDITATRTISMPNVGTAGSYGSSTSVATITTDTQGRVSAAASTAIAIPSTQVTDFTEAVQDAMGGALVDSATVDFVYNDVANTQTANVIPGGVNHDALLNFVSNEHIDHSTVSITAGTGLTGGGTIAATRTLALTNTGVTAGTYGDGNNYPSFTVDAQGRITAVSEVATTGVFGQGYQRFADTTAATTTSTTFSAGTTFTTNVLTNGATYRVGVFFSWAISANNNDARFYFASNGTQVGPGMRLEHSENANQSIWEYGFFEITGAGATATLTIQFAAENAGTTVTLQQAFFEIWRVS